MALLGRPGSGTLSTSWSKFCSTEEQIERLLEDGRMLVSFDEHGFQRGEDILPTVDLDDFERLQRIDDRARPDRNAGGAQRTREARMCRRGSPWSMFAVRHERPSAFADVALPAFCQRVALQARDVVLILQQRAERVGHDLRRQRLASSSRSAVAQSSVSATPGGLNRSCSRSACTNATICPTVLPRCPARAI